MSTTCSCQDPVICSCNAVLTPADQGRHLEDIIHTAALKIPGITRALKELEIRTVFNDPSLNGVDHMITIGSTHVLIQDKWKETITQQEVSQFITCAERIQTRLTGDNMIYLIWVSKREPTTNSAKMLKERKVSLVCCSVSLEALARCAILQICECLDVDPVSALVSIRSADRPSQMDSSRHESVSQTSCPILTYDETEEGKRDISEMQKTIVEPLVTMLRKVDTAISYDGSMDIHTLWNTTAPKVIADWYNGRFSKIDFTAFLKAVKQICWPTSKKALQSRSLFLYVKLRKFSVDLAVLANNYESKRKAMLTKKSTWAKSLSTLKVVAEPITEAEFKGAAAFCEDYWENRMNFITKKIEKVPAQHIDSAFWSSQCMMY